MRDVGSSITNNATPSVGRNMDRYLEQGFLCDRKFSCLAISSIELLDFRSLAIVSGTQ